jgi:RNA polymerase sigma-70 factor (ECF subfamily)
MKQRATDNFDAAENIKGNEFNFGKHELDEELARLDNEERLILSLSALMGYTSNEIARLCKINPATVRTKLARTKAKLREALG